MAVIVDFLTDAAKIVFGSAVIGFFIPGISGYVSTSIFIAGSTITIVFLGMAVALSRRERK